MFFLLCVSLFLDWEYPGYEPHSGTPADKVNYNLLLNDVRAALDELGAETGRFYGLTAGEWSNLVRVFLSFLWVIYLYLLVNVISFDAALPCGPSIIDNQDIEHVGRLVSGAHFTLFFPLSCWHHQINAFSFYEAHGVKSHDVSNPGIGWGYDWT